MGEFERKAFRRFLSLKYGGDTEGGGIGEDSFEGLFPSFGFNEGGYESPCFKDLVS
jgi:hypothetical protein